MDGMNCFPELPPDDPRSHSLLLRAELFIFLPWPPKAADSATIDPWKFHAR